MNIFKLLALVFKLAFKGFVIATDKKPLNQTPILTAELSPYDQWLELGNVGTKDDFLNSNKETISHQLTFVTENKTDPEIRDTYKVIGIENYGWNRPNRRPTREEVFATLFTVEKNDSNLEIVTGKLLHEKGFLLYQLRDAIKFYHKTPFSNQKA